MCEHEELFRYEDGTVVCADCGVLMQPVEARPPVMVNYPTQQVCKKLRRLFE